MIFDKKWETEIYSAKRQLNKYPLDSLVSIVHYLFKKKLKITLALQIQAVELAIIQNF